MTIQQKPTLEQFLQWPEEKPYLEFIHGVVHQKTMPDIVHSFLQMEIGHRLRLWRDVQHGYTLTEQRCILDAAGEAHTVLPDVAWFSRQQVPGIVKGPVRVAPTLAVEILSADDRYSEVQEKVLVYLNAGVSVVWVVDPLSRKVSIYRPGQVPEVVGADAILQDAELPGLTLSVGELFAQLPPAAPQPRLE